MIKLLFLDYRDHEMLAGFTRKLQPPRKHRGNPILVSDHLDWTPEQIVETYRSLSAVEEAFKNMKNIRFLRWQPAYHWTDQKLRVHAFYCVLALLLATLARKAATISSCPNG